MSRETITKLEHDLNDLLAIYETDHEITTAEVCGILGVLQFQRYLNATNLPAEAVSGPPVGEILQLEGKDSMET